MIIDLEHRQFELEHLINDLFSAICGLSEANFLTGYYDNKSHNMRLRKPYEEWTEKDKSDFYIARKRARNNVELRAKWRGECEKNFKKIVNIEKD